MVRSLFEDPQALAPPVVQREDLSGGAFVLRSPEMLRPSVRCVGDWLERWARETPDALAFAEPAEGGGWMRLSWRELRTRVGSVAQALLDLGLDARRPIAVLSDNGLDHLVLLLAGMHIGRPVCAVSSGYCRLAGGDFTRIHGILRALDPSLIYAADASVYAPALKDADVNATVVFSKGAEDHPDARTFASLTSAQETPQVMAAFAAITPNTHAKYLLTSGSTGNPKVVINTHRMLTANQQMLAQTVRFLDHEKPVLLDWLPWSHTFGANHNLNLVLRTGGTMYIDDGRPMPGAIDKTLAHLRDVQPTLSFNVPRGFEMMLPALEADAELATRFFSKLRMLFYAAASMPVSTWQRLEAVAARVREEPLWFTTAWGSTETAPASTFAHWRLDGPGVIGLPLPGVELKFVPSGDKLEMRVRGPHLSPGYLNNAEATAAAFDEDGYYRIGDAGRLLDPEQPSRGVLFDGRVAEDFKLTSGTWVSVGTLRLAVVTALAPFAQDVVVTGHDRADVGVLVFLTQAARALPVDDLASQVHARLTAMKSASGAASSQVPARALLLQDSPDMMAGEITDKGYINQRRALEQRAAEVEKIYVQPTPKEVIVV